MLCGRYRASKQDEVFFGRLAAEVLPMLVAELGQPSRLREIGVSRSDFSMIAEKSLAMLGTAMMRGNPKPIRNTDDITEILELVF